MAAAANEYVATSLADDVGASALRASLASRYSWPREKCLGKSASGKVPREKMPREKMPREKMPREKSVPRQIGAVEFRIRKPTGYLIANLGRVGDQATDKLFSERINY